MTNRKKMKHYPAYTVAIRTLGKAGQKYLTTLQSAKEQDVPPEKILVYIPHGYALPPETVGTEEYVRCDKGMVTQRSLPFDEIQTEWILFLDDDMYLPPDTVRRYFDALEAEGADCITPNVFPNHQMSPLRKIRAALGGTLPHHDPHWAFKIRRSSAYSYNARPRDVMPTQSGSFNCLLVSRRAYDAIHYADERWLDRLGYALGDDQLFFYKLYRHGFKVLVHYTSGVKHLDAGSAGGKADPTRSAYVSGAMRYLLWWRTQYTCAASRGERLRCTLAYAQLTVLNLASMSAISLLRLRPVILSAHIRGIAAGRRFARSAEGKQLPAY